jgi:hypothetical protein
MIDSKIQRTIRKARLEFAKRPRLPDIADPYNPDGRHLTPAESVRETVTLSAWYRERFHRMSVQIDFNDIIDALTAKKVPFVLTGAHGIASWTGAPRSTKDVDILAKGGRNCVRAVKVIRALYPTLQVRDLSGVMAFFPPGEIQSVIDVTYPHRVDIQNTLETAIWIEDGRRRYRIPTLEAALTNKYGAMLSPIRDPAKRAQDAVDFMRMVRHSDARGRKPVDLTLLESLAKTVWPSGGGKEILAMVAQARAGSVPTIAGK